MAIRINHQDQQKSLKQNTNLTIICKKSQEIIWKSWRWISLDQCFSIKVIYHVKEIIKMNLTDIFAYIQDAFNSLYYS